jgi:dephospho-CoA kinase
MKLAFVGPPAVGKDAVSAYVEEKYSLEHISSSDLVRKHITLNNLGGLDRPNMQMVANKLRKEQGGDILVRIAMEKAGDDVIVSGLRAIDEIKTFKKMGGTVITISAPFERRYELAKLRNRIGDGVSLEEFRRIETDEKVNIDKNGQNVDEVVKMADIEIVNDGTLEDLYRKCDEVIKSLRS